MKRSLNAVAILAVLVLLGVSLVTLKATWQGISQPTSSIPVFDSSAQTPDPPPVRPTVVTSMPIILGKPISSSETPRPTSLPQPNATDPVLPISTSIQAEVPTSPTSSPTPFPTTDSPLPPGLKLAFTEILGDRVNIWAASVAQPDARRILATLDRPNDLGLNISLSPEGHRIAYTVVPDHFKPNGLLAELRLLDLRTGQERTLATNIDLGGYENYPLWSPDGVYLAYRRQSATGTPYTQSLTLLHVNSGQEQTVATGDDSTWLWFKAWSPDSHDVYFSRGIANAELWRLDVTQPGHAAELVNQMWNGPLPPRCRALSPDGQWLVCTVLSSQDRLKYAVILVPTSSTGETVTVFESLEGNYSPIWYPNGREVLINEKQGEGGSLVAIDINSRVARTIATRRQEFFIPQGFSPDGEWITTQIFPDSEGSLLMIRSDGTQEQPVTAQGLVNLLGWITNESANLH